MTDDGASNIDRDLQLMETEDDAADSAARDRQKHIHTSMPGIVRSYDPATQTATVQPAIKRVWVDLGPIDLPQCVDVPCYYPAGGDFVHTFPIRAGDECTLHFSERAMDFWFENGGVQLPSEYRLHDYSDAFAFVGFSSKPRAIPNVATDASELRTRDGATMFRLEAGAAYVGAKLGAQATAMMDAFLPALNAYLAAIATAAAIGTLADPFGGPPALTALTNATTAWLGGQTSFKSVKAKVF